MNGWVRLKHAEEFKHWIIIDMINVVGKIL